MDEAGNAASEPIDLLAHVPPDAKWEDGFRPTDVDFDECGRLLLSSDGSEVSSDVFVGSKIVRIESIAEQCEEPSSAPSNSASMETSSAPNTIPATDLSNAPSSSPISVNPDLGASIAPSINTVTASIVPTAVSGDAVSYVPSSSPTAKVTSVGARRKLSAFLGLMLLASLFHIH